MEDNFAVNKITENEDPTKLEFKYNFIDTPWDDRSKKSKIGIVVLLIAIFLAIMACVINNLVMHYRGFGGINDFVLNSLSNNINSTDINCFRVKPKHFRYVARIHSLASKELLCVGAVVSPTTILANGICVKSGPIRIQLGNTADPYCKKGFAVESFESIYHDGALSKELVLLTNNEDKKHCISVIDIGEHFNKKSKIFIIGRSDEMGLLSQHYVTLSGKEPMNMGHSPKNLNIDSLLCVRDTARCPVRVGDLLVQDNKVFGLAATSVQNAEKSKYACFASLKIIRLQLKQLDSVIRI